VGTAPLAVPKEATESAAVRVSARPDELRPASIDGIRLKGNRLRVQHVGTIRVCLHREVEGKIKTLSLKREADKWFLVVASDVGEPAPVRNVLPAIGIDVGLTHFATLSDGEKIENPRYLKAELPELRRAQRSVSRKKKGGSNRKKAKRRVARIHARVANLRREHQHKISNDLISRYGKIAVESLNVQGMVKNDRLARAICDVAWSSFVAVLTHKVAKTGGEVVQVSLTTQANSALRADRRCRRPWTFVFINALADWCSIGTLTPLGIFLSAPGLERAS
jgi:putative transposase